MTNAVIANPDAFEASVLDAYSKRSAANDAQAAAMERFAQQRLPHRRVEGWKWTDFNAALRNVGLSEDPQTDAIIEPSPFAALDPIEFRIVDGRIEVPAGDFPEGVQYGVIDAMATIPELENHPIVSLNVAMIRKALGFEVKEGVQFERPILIRHIISRAAPTFVQTLLRVGRGASCQVIETYEGEGAGLYSHLCHMAVRDEGRFNRAVLQETAADVSLHAICAAKMDGEAHYEQATLTGGSRLARHETHLHYVADGASARLDSAALVSGERHSDITTNVLHMGEGCETRQTHKGVVKDRGRNVFQGKFHVLQSAQKTDADMQANALLLSDTAEANHKPELEIYADDVECAHGSTAGALDDDALFYLRQRGLDENTARSLLIEAFVGAVIDGVEHDGVRDVLRGKTTQWLEDV